MDFQNSSSILNKSFNLNTPGLGMFNYNPMDYFKDYTEFKKSFDFTKYSIGGGDGEGGLGFNELLIYIICWVLLLAVIISIIIFLIMGWEECTYENLISLLILIVAEIILSIIIMKKLRIAKF